MALSPEVIAAYFKSRGVKPAPQRPKAPQVKVELTPEVVAAYFKSRGVKLAPPEPKPQPVKVEPLNTQEIEIPSTPQVKAEPDLIGWPLGELESFFNSADLPADSIKISSYETITDISGFITASLTALNANNGNIVYLPYLNRLERLKIALEEKTRFKPISIFFQTEEDLNVYDPDTLWG